ncbi:MFS transporter [Streptomyces spinoverrucosus]|uniref:MFS transporter n=1 Tax=Streptomyces spinoverrucosus TaxID=284043 RepID=UPI0018C35662|nr:MFS transporter [Streptomyces spinoverrucosus]MBG0851335.1 MFS transporter [Streptomyces spinoverrucosus]
MTQDIRRESSADEDEKPPGNGWLLATTSLAAVLMTLDITVVNVALPEVAADLDAGLTGLQWVVNAYTLVFAALLLPAGALSDRIGRRNMFLTGVAVFTVASAGCGAAPGVGTLIACRAAQGLGGAMVMSTALALIAGAYQGPRRQSAIGMFSAAGGAAAALGPLVGGAVVEGLDWRWIFYVNLPVGALIIAGAALRVPRERRGELPRPEGRFDLVGLLLAAGALLGLNYGLVTGPEDGWTSASALLPLVGGALLVAGFAVWETRRRDAAMFDVRLLRVPSFTGAIVLSFVCRVVSFGVLPYLILWLSGMLGHSPLGTGLRLLAMTAFIMLVAPFSGLFLKLMPTRGVMALGTGITAIGLLTMARVGPDDSWLVMLPGLVMLGIGGAIAFPPLMGIAVGVVPPERAGMASGMTNTFFPLGTAAGVAAFGAVFSTRIDSDLDDARLASLQVPEGMRQQVRDAVAAGQFGSLERDLPATAREPVLDAARSALTGGLATICLAAAVVSLLAALASWTLIRDRDQLSGKEAADAAG